MNYGEGHQTLSATTPDQLPVLVNGLLGGRAVVKDALCHASLRYKQEGKKKALWSLPERGVAFHVG